MLLRSQVCQKYICWPTQLWTTLISIVVAHSAGSILFLSTNLYGVLPGPTQVPSMSKLYFVDLLIYMDHFDFHCHCQFNWIYFLVTNLYCVLPSPTLEHSHVIYLDNLISIVVVNWTRSLFWVLLIQLVYNQVLLVSSVCQECIM